MLFSVIFEKSLEMKGFWVLERANITLIFKIVKKEDLKNYMVTSLISYFENIMDKILEVISWKNNNMIGQSGFPKGKSWLINQIAFCD